MKFILTLLCLSTIYIASAQIQNSGLDQWEEVSNPLFPYQDLVGWTTSNIHSFTPATWPFPDTSVTRATEDGRQFAKMQSNSRGQDSSGPGFIEQRFSSKNLKTIKYISRCDSIYLLGRCLVQIYSTNPNVQLLSDTTILTSKVFEEKTIEIDPSWTQLSDSLTIRLVADGYFFGLMPEMEGYAVFSIDEVEADYITSTKNNILDSKILEIHPNPSAGIYNFKIDDSLNAKSIFVYNTQGQIILEKNYSPQLDLTGLGSGTYIISIQTGRGMITKKITKD